MDVRGATASTTVLVQCRCDERCLTHHTPNNFCCPPRHPTLFWTSVCVISCCICSLTIPSSLVIDDAEWLWETTSCYEWCDRKATAAIVAHRPSCRHGCPPRTQS